MGEDDLRLLRDPYDACRMMEDMQSAVTWVSPLFYSADRAIVEAIKTWMSCSGSAVAWSLFDDLSLSPPDWPTMERESPWRPSLSICRVREWTNLQFRDRCEASGAPPSFSEVKDMMISIDNKVKGEEKQWLPGLNYPEWPVLFPATYWGATPMIARQRKELLRGMLEEELGGTDGGAPPFPVSEIAAGLEDLAVAQPPVEMESVGLVEEESGGNGGRAGGGAGRGDRRCRAGPGCQAEAEEAGAEEEEAAAVG